jgi:catechol 2,3-dioxygenase-like lactoylglutathione lyase family enzyme
MDPRLSFVTLVVRDLDASRRFYVEGLGWPVEFEAPGEVVMIRVADKVVFSLWQERDAVGELGLIGRAEGAPPFTLAHNVATPSEVDRVIAEAAAAGATVVHAATARDWGGYSGYFADPDGFRWEVAYNPGPVGQSVL